MNRHNFLSQENFDVILSYLPKNGWRPAKVYSKDQKKSYVNKVVRKSEKNYEKRRDVLRSIKQIVMKPVIECFKNHIPNFRRCWVRNNQTEWIRYYEGDFFKPHKDFEKYICNGMIPYVIIIGLNDVEEGGETKVENEIFDGSSKKNGAILFQANLTHESLVVKKGLKIALKLEFFVYADSDYIKVQDKDNRWISYWSTKELELLDNYFKSHLDFERSRSKNLIVSEELARDSFNLGIMIADPRLKLPSEIDLLFPGFTVQSIRELFLIYKFMNDTSQKFLFCNDPLAWDYLNQHMELPTDCGLYVGIWVKKDLSEKYKLKNYYNRRGDQYHYYYQFSPLKENNEYADYEDLKIHVLDKFLKIFDHYDEKNINLEYKIGKHLKNGFKGNIFKFIDEPSDTLERPIFHSGKTTITEREFCNEEDAGYITYTYKEYLRYYIQIRYFLVRNNF